MSDQFGNTPPEPTYTSPPPPPPGYTQAPPPSQGYAQVPATDGGLSDTAAGAIAYITIIPAIIFLIVAPYNTKPFVKFHAFQCLGLAVVGFCLGIIGIIPILGWLILILGMICLFIAWILCILKASQGGAFKLPIIGKFAAEQSGYLG
jgi:uncharacterized membrane protein